MRSRRNVFGGVLAAAVVTAVAVLPPVTGDAARAAEPSSQSETYRDGVGAVTAWVQAVMSGDADTIRAVLAPEFQIMRADGSGYDAEGYLASKLPTFAAMPDIQSLVATRNGDILVTRYYISANQTRDGKVVETNAPRLTVFRRSGDKWLVVAHGNFAALKE